MDKREKELPLSDSMFDSVIWNPFFSDEVQAVLKTRKEVELSAVKFPIKGANSFLRAWPITAYKTVIGVVYWPHETEESKFFYYWNWDGEFLAKLFLAATRYKVLPESEWDLRRVLTECPRSGDAETYYQTVQDLHQAAARFTSFEKKQEFLRRADEGPSGGYTIKNSHRIELGDIPPTGLNARRAYNFKEIAGFIEESFPHLMPYRKKDGTQRKTGWADYLRTKIFYKEHRARQAILKDWESNLAAYERWQHKLDQTDFDYSSLSHRPHPRYYKTHSVTKKPNKK